MDSNSLLIGIFIGSVLTAALIFATRTSIKDALPVKQFPMGRYLGGLDQVAGPLDHIECKIDEVAYIFVTDFEREIARIPRSAVLDIFCEEKKELITKLTPVKNLPLQALGIATDRRKPTSGYCLVIDWDNLGSRQYTVFEFRGISPRADAHRVQTVLNSHRKSKPKALRFDEKYCPFCNEIVKKEAVLCKHCHSRITEPSLSPRF